MPVAIGVVAALLLLAWGGMEVNHFYHAYPGQFWMGAVSLLVIAFALAAAKFRKANERVPRWPVAPAVPPLPPAILAVPEQAAIAPPHVQDAPACEGPGCSSKVAEDPWTARVEGDGASHVFCSRECAQSWRDRRPAPSL